MAAAALTPQAEQQQQLAAAKAADATKDAQIKALEVGPACVVAVLYSKTVKTYGITPYDFCPSFFPIFFFLF